MSLKDTLGSSGLISDDFDLEKLTTLLQEYESNEPEWGHYALADQSNRYTRNLVDEGNGKSNLVMFPLSEVHLNTPPNIVRNGCYVFDEYTGKETHVRSCEYHSVHGKMVSGEHGRPLTLVAIQSWVVI